jgi:class 3 adenylate cyclase
LILSPPALALLVARRTGSLEQRDPVVAARPSGGSPVAAGVPRPLADHAHALVHMALEMLGGAKSCLAPESDGDLQLRIGISSGHVVAGVIGRRRFLRPLGGTP